MSMNARRTRTLRGVGAAVFASFTALASHIIAGGSAPNVFGMTVVIALSVFVCVLLARSSLSLWRLSASVIASQAMFHWMFSVLGHGPNMRQEPSSIAACQAPCLMESFLLGIHRLTHELRSPWHRAEMIGSERGGSRPTKCSVGPVRVEPVHPLRRGDLDIINTFPGTLVPDEFGLIE